MTKLTNAELLEVARKASSHAYAPYSNFRVGAAIALDDGTVVTGCNVENASYGLTICAERVAVFSAVAVGVKVIPRIAVAVVSPTGEEQSLMPCGACLQVLSEFMPADGTVLVAGRGEYRLTELLPHSFGFSARKQT